MVEYCCLCKTEQGVIVDVSFHRIPKNETSRTNWIKNIGREVSKRSVICSRHFEEKDFYYKLFGDSVRRFLVPTAVPSLLLNKNDSTFETIENVMDTTSDSLCISKISSYNNSKNIENMTNVEVIESDEIQFNKETNKDTNKLASKRKRSMPFTSSKRFCVPRYIGDLQRKDFTSDKSWQIVCVCMIMYIIQEVNVQSYSKK